MLNKADFEEKDDNYWQGYIQKQNEAMEICKQCKYKKKANKHDSLVKKVQDKIKELDNLTIETQKELGSASKEYIIYVYQKDVLQELLKEVEE